MYFVFCSSSILKTDSDSWEFQHGTWTSSALDQSARLKGSEQDGEPDGMKARASGRGHVVFVAHARRLFVFVFVVHAGSSGPCGVHQLHTETEQTSYSCNNERKNQMNDLSCCCAIARLSASQPSRPRPVIRPVPRIWRLCCEISNELYTKEIRSYRQPKFRVLHYSITCFLQY